VKTAVRGLSGGRAWHGCCGGAVASWDCRLRPTFRARLMRVGVVRRHLGALSGESQMATWTCTG